jgi:two-component system OmpR family sensor kinase
MSPDAPPRSPRWSLRRRLIALLLAVVALATIAQALLLYRSVLDESGRLFDYQMQQMAEALEGGRDVPRIGPAEPPGELEDFAFVVNIRDLKGRLLFSNGRVTFPAKTAPGFSDVKGQRETYRLYTLTGPHSRIQVAQELDSRSEIATGLALRSLWPMLGFALASLALVFGVVWHGFRDLTRLREQIDGRRAADLQPLPETGLPEEIRPLVADFNALLDRVRQAFELQQRFVSDAAHELRSPLAAVQLQGDAIRRAETAEQRDLALTRQREGIQRATRLVEQLLALARQDARLTADLGEVAELRDVAQECEAELSPHARAKGVELQIDVQADASSRLPRTPLRSILGNLIDNAVKYTPAPGLVRVSARREDGLLLLCVEDSGPGIPDDERGRVTDRFYRRAGSAPFGSGLGLAIVEEAVDAVGGHLRLDDSPDLGGLRVTCVLHDAPGERLRPA